MEPEEPALQCVLCKDWFHPRCIAKLDRPLYHGEYRYFTFSCSMCNAGIEVCSSVVHCYAMLCPVSAVWFYVCLVPISEGAGCASH